MQDLYLYHQQKAYGSLLRAETFEKLAWDQPKHSHTERTQYTLTKGIDLKV